MEGTEKDELPVYGLASSTTPIRHASGATDGSSNDDTFGSTIADDLSGDAPISSIAPTQENLRVNDGSSVHSTLESVQKYETPRDAPKSAEADLDAEHLAEMERRESIVQNLARQFTSQSAMPLGNPFFASENSSLNPGSKTFNSRAWAKSLVDMSAQHGTKVRTLGVCFQNLNVYGFGEASDYQKNVLNVWFSVAGMFRQWFGAGSRRIDILRSFDGVLHQGEMLVVLGPPGSGCSTFLKTLSGETNGLSLDDGSYFNYQGLSARELHSYHRGEAIYTAEVDVHFPQLTVGDTLTFAAQARRPRQLPEGVDRDTFVRHLRDVVMAMFGISHTIDTRVGNDYIRGVSGGERKRTSISEAALSAAPFQCWDNSTRGLDSANAIEFCRTLRLSSELFNTTTCASIYQSPQSAYDLFDKVTVLYEGRQIYFGPTVDAKDYFVRLGFECPARATTADFLTSMTSPRERIVRQGWKGRTPQGPEDFVRAWTESAEHKSLQAEIEAYKVAHPLDGPDAENFRAARRAFQAKAQRANSPYTLSFMQQIQLCLWRGWRRLIGDPSLSLGALIGNFCFALVIGSVFYNLSETSGSFFERGALLFFVSLMNAFSSALEIITLYAQRPIVEKHSRYALYHPSAEAISSMLCDMPYKILNAIIFNITVYFMTNLRREPGAFFYYLLISFVTVLTMSMVFRFIASASRSLSQAMVPAAMLILALIIFSGFAIPINYMLSWCRWINYLDPLAYSFEALMVNEFHGRNFACSGYVPSYANVGSNNHVCASVGAVPGQDFIQGDVYLASAFQYSVSHRWRNFGILIAFVVFGLIVYIIAAEFVSAKKSKGEVLLFRRGHKPSSLSTPKPSDTESLARVGPVMSTTTPSGNRDDRLNLQQQTSVFHWSNVCYDVNIKGSPRRILDHVDGWVKPGTLTALMGVSGAGKTTLLDCLADRTSVGVISGDMLVDGQRRDKSFQRKTGYVQQQDLHLPTTTVREALNFSALLRQPQHIPRQERLAYVDEVIKLLDMNDYADAVVGVPGEGLNVEQRKRLTIGVELAAKPPLLLFVDEPTSGLDSQTSWAILDLLEKLTKNGQAILCTIHQPSAMLFQRFDRLLFLASGGRTVYFGDIGANSKTMINYFEGKTGAKCPDEANPAEWMLQIIGAAPGSSTELDWFKAWRESSQYQDVQTELQGLKNDETSTPLMVEGNSGYTEFSAPFHVQLWEVGYRVFQQYWRTPMYIYSKAALCISVALFVGFVFFQSPNTIQGLQNQMFAIFNLITIIGQLVQQTMPHFVIQRSLYEARERPSKVYSWKIFMLSQIIVELPWQTIMAVLMFFCWYYPIGLEHNAIAAGQVTERGILMFLFVLQFLLFSSTFTDFMIAGFETADAGGNIANLLFTLCLIFCGVLANPSSLPRFWIFMYRISPFTYLISGMLSTGLANTNVVCAPNELLSFQPLNGTCQEYMASYISSFGGYLVNSSATDRCQFCRMNDTNTFLASVASNYADRWRNFGLLWVFIAFNICGALVVYWIVRVPKQKSK